MRKLLSCIILGICVGILFPSVVRCQDKKRQESKNKRRQPAAAKAEFFLRQFDPDDNGKLDRREMRAAANALHAILHEYGPQIDFPSLNNQVIDVSAGAFEIQVSTSTIPDSTSVGADYAELEIWAKTYNEHTQLPNPINQYPSGLGATQLVGTSSFTGSVDADSAIVYGLMRPQTLVVWEVVRYYEDICGVYEELVSLREIVSTNRTFYGHTQ